MKGQAALFDSIFFLIIVMGAVTMLFQFVYSYGASQDNAIRSAYTLDFLQSLMKSIYYVDAGSISSDLGECDELSNWAASGTVAECIKLDAEDGRLNNSGAACGKVGLTAMRCVMNEFMKPYVFSGYSYTVEMQSQNGTAVLADKPISNEKVFLCQNANATEIVAVSTPFRVLVGDSSKGQMLINKLTICVWPRKS